MDADISGKRLLYRSFTLYISLLIFVSAVLFTSAGTFSYWNVWVFLIAFFGSDLCIVIALFYIDPVLLYKRLNRDEKEKNQKIVNLIYYLFITAVLIFSGLSYRFLWSAVSLTLVLIAAAVVVLGFLLSFVVMMQNRYASRVIELQEGQEVIDTGLYSVIRHPMYTSALLIFCPAPLVLGSWHLFLAGLVIVPVLLVFRISGEESTLKKELPEYSEYLQKVKYRLIPFIW